MNGCPSEISTRSKPHAGSAALTELADRLGWTAVLSAGMAPTRRRRSVHDPGQVVRDLIVSIRDGGDCLADLSVLRNSPTCSASGVVPDRRRA
jgi:hypothetical protein